MSDFRSSPWVPIRRQLLDSSIWEADPKVRVLWITMLLIAHEPGRRGTIDMTTRALAGRACLPENDTREALRVLMEPDRDSRSQEHEGRRLLPLDADRSWGWRIVNWEHYELDRDRAFAAARQRRHKGKRANDSDEDASTYTKEALPDRDLPLLDNASSRFGNTEKENEKENEKVSPLEKGGRFKPPSVEEVRTEITRRGIPVDAEAFVAFYESKGWKVGTAPMKSWHAALTTWAKRAPATSPPRPGGFFAPTKAQEEEIRRAQVKAGKVWDPRKGCHIDPLTGQPLPAGGAATHPATGTPNAPAGRQGPGNGIRGGG